MTTSEIEYLDGEFTVLEEEPSTPQEVIALVGEQTMVDEAVYNLRYRNKYPRVYKLVSAEVEKLGWSRAILEERTKKDGTIKKIKESENDHLRSYLKGRKDDNGKVATAPPPDSRTKLEELFSTIAPKQPLYVKGERAGGAGKISQRALDYANKCFAEGDEEAKAAFIESMVPGFKLARDGEGNLSAEGLARGVQALEKHLAKQAERQTKEALDAAKAA